MIEKINNSKNKKNEANETYKKWEYSDYSSYDLYLCKVKWIHLVNISLFVLSDLEKYKLNQRRKAEWVKIFKQTELFESKNQIK